MLIYANAKINLALDVLGKRDDGYHEVSMIMQEVSLYDVLELTSNSSREISLTTKNAVLPSDEGNIVYRAAELFFRQSGICGGCNITLEKNIPVCAGLGGGSSDAAAVLKALNKIYGFPLDTDALLKFALSLGADVPFFIRGKTAHAGGIGEILTPVKSQLSGWAVLIKPDIDISTPQAYKVIDSADFPHPDVRGAISAIENGDTNALGLHAGNAFEYVCRPLYKEIDIIKNHLMDQGASFAMMSGSGPTVFGLFQDERSARNAFETYRGSYQGGGVCELIV